MIFREANIDDWGKLKIFFTEIYRKNHPLQNKEFWNWQYGNSKYGRSLICLSENDEIIGHLGVNFGGGLAWTLNLFICENYRGKGISEELHDLVRQYYPLAAVSASEMGLKMYRRLGWIRYYNLVRYVKVNPEIEIKSFENVCKPIEVSIETLITKKTHFAQQPTIKCIGLKGNSIAVSQQEVGGLRLIDFENLNELEEHAWSLGFLWLDYVTSWNDFKTEILEQNSWVLDYKGVVPWLLNPVKKNHFCEISFLSEKPLENEFIVRRYYSDHGRIGSL